MSVNAFDDKYNWSIGILFGLLAGFFDSIKNVLAKKDTSSYSETLITFTWMLFASVVTVPLALFSIPNFISLELIVIFAAVTALDFYGYIFYLKSLKFTDLSLSLPMLAFTPVFVLIISFLFFHQTVSSLALLGIMLIITGAYWLNIQKGKVELLAPIKQIYQNIGVRYMLMTSILWGFAGSLHKIGITDSNPLFYTGISYALLTLLYFVLLIRENKSQLRILKNGSDIKILAPVGILEGTSSLFQYLSQGLIASSVITISLKRSSIVFSAVFGKLFFREKIRERMVPIGLVVIGIVLLAL